MWFKVQVRVLSNLVNRWKQEGRQFFSAGNRLQMRDTREESRLEGLGLESGCSILIQMTTICSNREMEPVTTEQMESYGIGVIRIEK